MYFLIKNRDFKAKQVHNGFRSTSHSDYLHTLLRRYSSEERLNVLSLLTHDEKMQATHGGTDDFRSFLVNNGSLSLYKDTPSSFEILGVCDGIICFNDRDDRIIIANPATRKLRILPECCNCQVKPTVITLRFGYDPKTNDYKVVRVVYNSRSNDRRLPQSV
ncbi:hypothetical protein SLE2022_063340 [Rubroshorea leprosula]